MSPEQPTANAANPLPTWLSIPIILLCLLGGGWIIHWYVMTDPLSHEAKILGDAPMQAQWQNAWPGGGGGPGGPGGRGRNNGNNPRRYIQPQPNGQWEMRTEQARVMVSLANGKLNWRTITYTGNYPFVPADVKNTIYSARAIANPNDTARATALKLTPEQVKRLRGLSVVITMNVSDSDKTELSASIEAYINAAQPERNQLEPKLLQLIDQIAQKSIPATRNLAVQRAAQINSIITPEMWKQDAAMGGAGGPGNPTNKPVPPSASPPAPAK